MLGGDTAHSGYAPDIAGPRGEPTVRWEYDVTGPVTTPPVVGPDAVYVADGARQFHGIDIRTGEVALKKASLGALAGGADVVAAAAVGRDRIYLPTNDGSIWGIDPRQGAMPWQFSVLGATASVHYTSPVLRDGVLVVGGASETVLSIDIAEGDRRWSATTDWPVIYGPAVDGETVYVAGGGVSALAADTGDQRWSVSAVYPLTAPVLDGDTVYVQTADEGVVALATNGGGVNWHYTAGEATASRPAVDTNTVYVGRGATIHAVDAETGEQVWRAPADTEIRSAPAVTDGTVYVGTEAGTVLAVDADTGGERWRVETGSPIRSAPGPASGSITVGCRDGTVLTLE